MERERQRQKKEFEDAFEAWQFRVGNIFDKMESFAADAEAEEAKLLGRKKSSGAKDRHRRKSVFVAGYVEGREGSTADHNEPTTEELREQMQARAAGGDVVGGAGGTSCW